MRTLDGSGKCHAHAMRHTITMPVNIRPGWPQCSAILSETRGPVLPRPAGHGLQFSMTSSEHLPNAFTDAVCDDFISECLASGSRWHPYCNMTFVALSNELTYKRR
jgi:hypothetical protein